MRGMATLWSKLFGPRVKNTPSTACEAFRVRAEAQRALRAKLVERSGRFAPIEIEDTEAKLDVVGIADWKDEGGK
jgi:ribosomal protein S16